MPTKNIRATVIQLDFSGVGDLARIQLEDKSFILLNWPRGSLSGLALGAEIELKGDIQGDGVDAGLEIYDPSIVQDKPTLTMFEIDNPIPAWQEFYSTMGAASMMLTYDWDKPPAALRLGERVWLFRDQNDNPCCSVGWSSLIPDPHNPVFMYLAIGIWPAHQAKGHRTPIVAATARKAFVDLGAVRLTMHINDSNPIHLKACYREWETGITPWMYAGRVWFPEPKYRIFTLTKDDNDEWQARQPDAS